MKYTNNYDIQLNQAKKRFLTYDQQELICRCCPKFDELYFYTDFLGQKYRIDRRSGDMQRLQKDRWIDGNSFHEVMTLLDWLCDSREDRFVTGRWVNIVTLGHSFHRSLQEDKVDSLAQRFAEDPEKFSKACRKLGGQLMPGADSSFAVPFIDGMQILVQLWLGDEEFAPRLCFLWDENTTRYIRYETTWYALGLLRQRLEENM